MASNSKSVEKCSFCGKDKKETNILIAGFSAHICDNCVAQAQNIIKDELGSKSFREFKQNVILLKPTEIKNYLDEYIIGQDEAKKVLSVAVYNHYKRILQKPSKKEDDIEIEKSNIILVGETGTGKTLLAKTIAKLLNVPFCIADATVFTEAGYVGEDVESILTRLLQAADYDIAAAERGIVFIDEIDKISRKSDNPSITRDVSGEGVQQALLKLIEGSNINVPPQGGRKHPDQKFISLNTKNILFICGGAFEGIDKIISRRLNTASIGYAKDTLQKQMMKENLIQFVTPKDLRAFGIIPELIGRLPVLSYLNPLDRETLLRILSEPKNAIIKQYKKLFDIDGIEVSFHEDVLGLVVDKAIEYRLGARGLRTIMEAIMTDAMFEMPGVDTQKELFITLDYAKNKLEKSRINQLKVA
jgi:ATP-dependent Clp protease ATP-binding subunit ClpX